MPGVSPMSVLPSKRGRFPLRKAMRLLAERSGKAGPGLAARLPAFRPYVIERLIDTAARRNGFIATAVWIPGADMPLLTAVQLRLMLEIGVCHGVELSPDRAVELISVLGAGFGMRTVARELLDFVPVAGWALQGAVAYGGTRAVGPGGRRVLRPRCARRSDQAPDGRGAAAAASRGRVSTHAVG